MATSVSHATGEQQEVGVKVLKALLDAVLVAVAEPNLHVDVDGVHHEEAPCFDGGVCERPMDVGALADEYHTGIRCRKRRRSSGAGERAANRGAYGKEVAVV